MTNNTELVTQLNNLYAMLETEGYYTKANTAALAATRIEQLTNALTEAHSMLLWCERRMLSPSISTYPKDLALKIERIINDVPSV